MKKKFLNVIMTLVFALALGCTGAAVLSTSEIMSASAAGGAQAGEGDDVTVSQSADRWGVTVSNSTYIKQTMSGNTPVYTASYAGAQLSITLPAGRYKLQAYGASGGGDIPRTFSTSPTAQNSSANQTNVTTYGGNTSWNTRSSRGGAGGYVDGIINLPSATTLYLYIGGAGRYGVVNGGGWNGGGHGGPSNSACGGGGGATDIRIGGTSYNHRVLVAGGGGGADNVHTSNGAPGGTPTQNNGADDDGSGGAGGGTNGQQGVVQGVYKGSYPTQTSYGGSNTVDSSHTGRSGSFGAGASATLSTDTGGGGGGWYGGSATNHNQGGAGGGSSYVLTSSSARPSGYAHNTSSAYNMTSTHNIAGIWNGNGKIIITMQDAVPVTLNTAVASTQRGTASAELAPTDLATDSDYTPLKWADTNKIYEDANCTNAVASTKLTVSGMSANGTGKMRLTPQRYFASQTFYVKIKDSFTTPLVGYIAFTFGSTDNDITQKTGVNSYSTGNGYSYKVGPSTTNSVAAVQGSGIYNPSHSGSGVYTVVIPKPIAYGADSVYINAKDLFNDGDIVAGSRDFDELVITSVSNASTTVYEVLTSSADYKYSKGYTRVRVARKSAAAASNYLNSVTLTVRAVEKSTGTFMGTAKTIQLVFKVDNTRPKIQKDYLYHSSVDASSLTVNLEDFCYDFDRNRNEIKEIKVPTHEFLYLNRNGEYRSYDYASSYEFPTSVNGKATNSLVTGEGTKSVSFEPESIVSSYADTSKAYLTYTIDPNGQFFTLTPLRATRSQYASGESRVGHFYFMVRVEDKGDPTDTGIWYPIAVQIDNTNPSQPTSVAVADSSSARATTETVNGAGQKVMYFSPMGIGTLSSNTVDDEAAQLPGIAEDRDSFASFVTGVSDADKSWTYMYNEFLLFDETQFNGGKIETEFYRIELVPIYAKAVTVAKLAGDLTGLTDSGRSDMSWKRYSECAASGISLHNNNPDVITFNGIRVTFLRSTNGTYIQQPIVVRDTRGGASSALDFANTVHLLVKVDNNPVTALTAAQMAANDGNITAARTNLNAHNGVNKAVDAKVKVSVDGNVVTYKVPNGYSFYLTPYDLATDKDVSDGWEVGVNTNPWRMRDPANLNNYKDGNEAYAKQLEHAARDLMYGNTTDLLSLSPTASALHLNRLVFDGDPQGVNMNAGTAVLDRTAGDGERVLISTTSRTSMGNPMTFFVRISDGEGSTVQILINVEVIDNKPELSEAASGVFYLSSNIKGLNANTTNSSNDYQADDSYIGGDLYNTGYNVREFTAKDLASDYEDSTLSFVTTSPVIYTMDASGNYQPYAYGRNYVDVSFAVASGKRTGQVLRVEAIACTQNIQGGLYIGVQITDGYGMISNDNTSTIIFQIEVTDSKPVVNVDADNGFVQGENGGLEWKISPSSRAEVTSEKYLVSNEAVATWLRNNGTLDKDIRIISADNDEGDGLLLYAGALEDKTGIYPNLPLYAEQSGNTEIAHDVAVLYTVPIDGYSARNELVEIVYFESNGSTVVKRYDSVYDKDRFSNIAVPKTGIAGEDAASYVDNPNWAIKIKSEASFARPMEFKVRVRDTSDRSRDDEYSYDGKRVLENGEFKPSAASVDGSTTLNFSVDIGSLGMVVTHNVYNRLNASTGEIDDRYFTEDKDGVKTPIDAFRYKGIDLSSGGSVTVPMSYFAFPVDIPENRNDTTKNLGVSYNNAFHDSVMSETEIFKHISITDGTETWSGSALNDNPFVSVQTFLYPRTVGNWEVPLQIESGSLADYLNLNVTSVTGGNTVYRDLYENQHGLILTARGPRTGKTPLKITLDLALWRNIYNPSDREIAKAQTEGDTEGQPITAKATVDLRISNQNIVVTESISSEVAVNTFSTGSTIPQDNTNTYTFRMSLNTSNDASLMPISYSDANQINNTNGMSAEAVSRYSQRYRDSANFLYNSLGTYTRASAGGTETFTMNNPVLTVQQFRHMVGTNGNLAYTEQFNDTLSVLANYLGIDSTGLMTDSQITTELRRLTQPENEADLNALLAAANPNKYYDDYFTVENGVNGDSFSISIVKKTSVALENVPGYNKNASLENNHPAVKAYANSLHLEVEIVKNNDGTSSYMFYFPLKVIVYDTFGGSEFEDGSWQLLTIKLAINNSKPTPNASLYGSTNRYMQVDLTMEDSYSLNIMDAINDRDMVKGANAYLTESGLTANGYDTNTHDWLIQSDSYAGNGFGTATPTGYICYNASYNTGGYYEPSSARTFENRKIDVTIKNDRIVFTALEKDTRNHTYITIRFTDNHGAAVDFNVFVRINNKAPMLLRARDNDGNKLPNDAYYANDSTDITMKTGDYFYLAVTPYDLYYNSLSAADRAEFDARLNNKDTAGFSQATASLAAIKANAFINDSTERGQEQNLGVYVIADDDSPETLQFSLFTGSTNDKFTVEAKNVYTTGGNQKVLTYKITAKGVCTKMPLRFTVMDDTTGQVSLTFSVTVKSTVPKLLDKAPDGMTREEDWQTAEVTSTEIAEGRVFALHIKNGEKYNLPLTALCNDPDIGDNEGMYLYKAFSGSPFSIGGNETGVMSSSYVSLTAPEDKEGKAHSLTIEPVNFFTGDSQKKFEQIVFYVMDKGGQSLNDAQKIIINVYVEPSDVSNPGITSTSVVTASHTVKSKAEYMSAPDGNYQPSRLQVVRKTDTARAASGLIVDPDYGQSATSYSIRVYAMVDLTLDDNGNVVSARNMTRGAFTAANVTDTGTGFTPYELKRYLLQNNGSMVLETSENVTKNKALYDYVTSFFDFDFGSDGSAIDFIPNNMTEGAVALYVEVSKNGVPDVANYKSSAYLAVSVANSAPTATEEGDFNKNVFTTGGEDFLHFVGRVGESRTYKVQDTVDANKGLFKDLDSNDTVTYVGAGGKNGGYVVLDSYDYGDGKGTVATNPGYKADASKGVEAAFTITSPSSGDNIVITIRRKVDVGEVKGAASVKIPVKIYGEDKNGARVENIIVLEICNSEPNITEVTDDKKPYSLTWDATADGYNMNISVAGGENVTVNLSDFYSDADRADNSRFDYINFVGGDGSSEWLTDIHQGSKPYHSVYAAGVGSDRSELFRISTNSYNDYLRFECVSFNRGSRGVAYLQIQDSVDGSRTKLITITMTVANTAPVEKETTDVHRIDMLGDDNSEMSLSFDIHDFFTDANPTDNKYYTDADKDGSETDTYMRIYSLEMVDIRLPGSGAVSVRPLDSQDTDNVFKVSIDEDNPQKFVIRSVAGFYGWQKMRLFVIDDGGRDFVTDAVTVSVTIEVHVAINPAKLEGNKLTIARGRTEQVFLEAQEGDDGMYKQGILDKVTEDGEIIPFSSGYVLDSLEVSEDASRYIVASSDEDSYGRVRHYITTRGSISIEDSAENLAGFEVIAKCHIGTLTNKEVRFKVVIGNNKEPWLKSSYLGDTVTQFYNSDEVEGVIRRKPSDFFDDDKVGASVLVFRSASSNMTSACDVDVDTSRNEIILRFKANTVVELTLEVGDEVNVTTQKIKIQCKDKPELSFFAKAMVFVKSNPLIFFISLGLLLLLILLLIIIILAVKKKRKMRREIEALLVSEMELEEQMLKLSSQNNANPYYQSYGYLPPTQQTPNAPMLGQGGATPPPPSQPTTTAIGLNPGETANNNRPNNNNGNIDGNNF